MLPGPLPTAKAHRAANSKSSLPYLANTALLFSQLKVLDIYIINSFSVATFMYSYHHNRLIAFFLRINQVHHSENLLAFQCRPHFRRTNIQQFSVLYRGPTIWNSLPISLTSSSSKFVSKKNSEKFSLDRCLSP